jgi:hypothetical protein
LTGTFEFRSKFVRRIETMVRGIFPDAMRALYGLVSSVLFCLSCEGGASVDQAPPVTATEIAQNGPQVVWNLGHRPLPEIPLPNDVATFADALSPTGLRLNASLIAPTGFESTLRAQFNELDGWGTFQPATVSFDQDLDLNNLTQRMRGDDHDFANDAVYIVNLRTGLPVPVDMGDGNFVYTARNRDGYYPNDPRGGQSNLMFETVNEDTNRNGVLDLGEDTNFDGRLNHASVFPAGLRPEDGLSGFWEADTRTLLIRPLVPLEERTRYAVVLTSRLRGTSGAPVRSPYPTIAHPTQSQALEALDGIFRGPNARYYGGLSWRPTTPGERSDRVTFAWMYTTQTTTTDLLELRRGLYGEGVFANAMRSVTPSLEMVRANDGDECTPDQIARPFIIRGAALAGLVDTLGQALGASEENRALLSRQYRYVDYIAFGSVRAPYLMGASPSNDPHAHWSLNTRTGTIEHLGTDMVQFALVVPKNSAEHRAPFPVALLGHGYTGNFTDALGFGPFMAAQGIATLGINGPGHGLVLDRATRALLPALLRSTCNVGIVEPFTQNRARDLDGDEVPDSGGDFWTAYTFHTRDNVRQLALDYMSVIRVLRGFNPSARAGIDYNGNGNTTDDIAGDFNGDGTPDVGGTDTPFFAMGGSLGGIMSMMLGSADASVRAAAPVSGGGGLADVGIRSTEGGIKEAVILRVMGPLVMSLPVSEYAPQGETTRTSCGAGQVTLRFIVPNLNDTGELEFACATLVPQGSEMVAVQGTPALIAPGDDVVVSNNENGEQRCARTGLEGRIRIGIPSDVDDSLFITIYKGSAVSNYGTCALRSDAMVRSTVGDMQVIEGDCGRHCGHIPPEARPTSPVRRWLLRGAPLRSPAEGLGIRRQTPEMRRFMLLAQTALDAGDPISYAPLYFLRRPADHQPHALLVINTIGDQAVPINTGNAFARAAGAIPFMAPGLASRYPEYADYATPMPLWQRYNRTPNRVLIDRGVLEGIAAIGRFPSGGVNNILFDVDDLDEGRQMYNEQFLMPPLRLVRRGVHADASTSVDAVWQPTLASWNGDTGPTLGVLNAYIRTQGTHSFALPEASQPWKIQLYLLNTIARFFSTNGADVYYRSHPGEHLCAEQQTCGFISPRPAM